MVISFIKGKNDFLSRFIYLSWLVLGLTCIFQCIFFPEILNVISVSIVFYSWYIITKFFFQHHVLYNYPLSSLLIIGFATTQFYFPIVFTLFEAKPLIFNLNLPFEVFFHSILALIVITLSHQLYKSNCNRITNKIRSILVKVNLYNPPSDSQLWAMGFIGMFSMIYVYFAKADISEEGTGKVIDKFIQGLTPFTYAPFFILVGKLYSRNRTTISQILLVKYVIYIIFLFIVSIASNIRSAFMLGFTSLGFAFLLGSLLGIFKPKLLTIKNTFIGLAVFWFFSGPVSDLGIAMVIVRAQKADISRLKLINETIDVFKDKKAIMARTVQNRSTKSEWDEYYLSNIFLAKFSNLKFNDSSLVKAAKINENDDSMFEYSIDRIWSVLPNPILTLLGIDVEKESVINSSFGDYLYYKSGADAVVLGGHRSGHSSGTGMAAFGWWYLLILGIGIIPVYVLFDSLYIKKVSLKKINVVRFSIFSVCGLLALTTVFQFLPGESVIVTITFILRGWFQMIFLYLIIFHLSKMLTNLLKYKPK